MLLWVVTLGDHPRLSPLPGLAPVSIWHSLPFNSLRIRTEHPAKDANPERASRAEGSSFPSNPLRIRTSKTPLPQPLYNPQLRSPLGCVGSKGLTGTRIHRQLFYNQHLRTPLGSAGNTVVRQDATTSISIPLAGGAPIVERWSSTATKFYSVALRVSVQAGADCVIQLGLNQGEVE
jgi:hypothetical protein